MTIEDDTAAIAGTVERYRQGFLTLDADLLISIWDRGHDGIVYIAMELAEPIRGWPQLEAYYRALPSANPVERVESMDVDDLSIDVLGDVALAVCRFRFQGALPGAEEPFVAEGRVTFVLHRIDAGWGVIHYHESGPPRWAEDH